MNRPRHWTAAAVVMRRLSDLARKGDVLGYTAEAERPSSSDLRGKLI
jgi:hypothetical protein